MDGGDDTDEKIQTDSIAFRDLRTYRFAADPCDTHLAVRLVGKSIMQVVEQLAVNAHRLHTVQHRVARSLQHQILFNGDL